MVLQHRQGGQVGCCNTGRGIDGTATQAGGTGGVLQHRQGDRWYCNTGRGIDGIAT